MNRQNFFGHLALAVTLILVAAFAGQMRRWHNARQHDRQHRIVAVKDGIGTPPAPPARLRASSEVIVRFRSNVSAGAIESLAARLNDRVEDRIETVKNQVVIADGDGLEAADVAAQYAARADVEYAEPNMTINIDPREDAGYGGVFNFDYDNRELLANSATPNDPMFGEQWALENRGDRDGKAQADISAVAAWGKIKGTRKVVVAVLDSGVDYTHPDLAANIWLRPANVAPYSDAQLGTVDDLHGYNAADQTGDPMDQNGHGTHCAGIVGAEGGNDIGIAGVNWEVEIMPLKFMSAGGFGTTKDAIEAINYAIERKRAGVNVRVISASWGSRMKSKALEDAIRQAGEEGILFIAASGNSSADADRSPHYPSGYNLPNVISVAALNRRDQLASFSNYGVKSVHIAAPGAEILSTWLGGEYEEHSGTSMATPVVSGVAALILAGEPDLTVKELRERLLRSVDKLEALDGKVATGGRINAARAVGAR